MAGSIARPVDRTDRWLLGISSVWAVGLVLVAFFAPIYGSTTFSHTGGGPVRSSSTTSTLVDVNGLRAVVLVSIPLIAVLVVAATLRNRRRRMKVGTGVLAWAVVVLLALFNLLGMLSIGIFILPVTVLLTATCARSR